MNRFLASTATLFVTACSVNKPAAEPPSWKVLGVGNTACADYLYAAHHVPNAREIYLQWLLGYITASNEQGPDISDVLSTSDLYQPQLTDPADKTPIEWLDDFCAHRPETLFHVAVRHLIAKELQELHGRQLREQWEEINERFEQLHKPPTP